eukprot:6491477-Pyramimonas_sp.AAC.1
MEQPWIPASSVICIVVPPNCVSRMRCACVGYRLEVAQPRVRTPVVFSTGCRSDADQPHLSKCAALH